MPGPNTLPRQRRPGAKDKPVNGGKNVYTKAANTRKPGRDYLKRQREEQQKVTEPLTPKGVRQETRAATNLKFRPLEKEIGGEIRASKQRTKETGDWWNNYLQEVSQGRAETQAAYDAAGTASQAQMEQASSIDSANTEKLNIDEAASAAVRGVSPSTAPAQRETAAQAQRNYLATAQAGTNRTIGANQFGYLTDQKRIGVGQSIASRKEEQRRTRSKEKDLGLTRRERGDYAATKRGEIREGERDYLINRQAWGMDKKKFGEEKRQARAGEAAGRQEAKASAAKEAYDRMIQGKELSLREQELAQEWTRIRKEGKGGKKGGLTPSEKREAKAGRQNAMSTAQSLVAANGVPKSPKEWAGLETLVAKESEVSPAEARQAVHQLRSRYEAREADEKNPGSIHR